MGLSVLVLRGWQASGWAERSEGRIPGGGVGVTKGVEVRNTCALRGEGRLHLVRGECVSAVAVGLWVLEAGLAVVHLGTSSTSLMEGQAGES